MYGVHYPLNIVHWYRGFDRVIVYLSPQQHTEKS